MAAMTDTATAATGSAAGRTAEAAGLYGPASMAWRLNREATLLLGAGPRALLMQLAHPLIAEGVAQHSDFRADPWRRLRGTLKSYLAIVYGTTTTARAEIRRLNGLHRGVAGPVLDPTARIHSGAERYEARDPILALWVHATLIDATLVAHDAWIRPLSYAERARFYDETRPIGRAFGIPDRILPADLDAFDAYLDAQTAATGPIRVTPTARELALAVLNPPLGPLHPALSGFPAPLYAWTLWPAVGLLPEAIRADYGLRWGPRERAVAAWFSTGFRAWRPLLPRGFRTMPQALAADARIDGRRADDGRRAHGGRHEHHGRGRRYPSAVTTSALLGIDLGTTQVKAGLIDLDGRLLALARAGYPMATDDDGTDEAKAYADAAEQDPAAWWAAIRTVIAALVSAVGPDRVTIDAIGLDGQGPTLVRSHDDGRPLGPAITWLDRRSAAEEADLTAATGEAGWVLGILPKALWAERHRPAVTADARWYLASWEWLGLRLSGVAAETTLPGQLHPDLDAVARTGLRTDRIPPRVAAGTVLGPLLTGPAHGLGLTPGIPVVAGMVDAHASILGAGLLEPGDAIDTGGTSGGFAVYTDRPIEIRGVFSAAAPIPGRWFLGGAMNATGKALDWLAEDVLQSTIPTDRLVAEALDSPPGADGLVFLPYLAGERSPIWDPTARGAFVGLTLRHGRAQVVRAVLEAADLAVRHVAAPILAAGIDVTELRVSGDLAHGNANGPRGTVSRPTSLGSPWRSRRSLRQQSSDRPWPPGPASGRFPTSPQGVARSSGSSSGSSRTPPPA